jgi:molybdenum cofactor cytidylyltransferase
MLQAEDRRKHQRTGMKFGPVPVHESAGKLLAHNLPRPDGRGFFRKGKLLGVEDVQMLSTGGHRWIYVAEIEPGDIEENQAALRVAQVAVGAGLRIRGSSQGRVDLMAAVDGILRIDPARLAQINACDGIAFATGYSLRPAVQGQTVATIKIIPYALPTSVLEQVGQIAQDGPVIELRALVPRTVGIVLTGHPRNQDRLLKGFGLSLKHRVEASGSLVKQVAFCPFVNDQDDLHLSRILNDQIEEGAQLILIGGETSIMDRNDVVPLAVRQAGGSLLSLGAPVEPGNLLMLAYIGAVPVVGAPGCARGRGKNVMDWVLPALLAGHHLTRSDITALGYGGYLSDHEE